VTQESVVTDEAHQATRRCPAGLYARMVPATREQRVIIVTSLIAGFAGAALILAHGGFPLGPEDGPKASPEDAQSRRMARSADSASLLALLKRLNGLEKGRK
jgi:hypothetical protein